METTTLVLTSTELTAIQAVLTAYAMGIIGKGTSLSAIANPAQAEATLKTIGRQVLAA